MAPITIGIGLLLVLLGVGTFAATQAPTALIPAGFGAVLTFLGLLARQDKLRKHAMHAAVLVGLIGLIGALARVVPALASGTIELPIAFGAQVAMAVLCGIFVAMCVKSFIDARRQQRSN